MQTFLTCACVRASLLRLDHRRLQKQLLEAVQILRILNRIKSGQVLSKPGYAKHPAVLMWLGREKFLRYYACCCSEVIAEVTHRVKDGMPYDTCTLDTALREELGGWINLEDVHDSDKPAWFGDQAFHSAHRASLYRKNPVFYAEFQSDSLLHSDYHWPVRVKRAKTTECACKRSDEEQDQHFIRPAKRSFVLQQ